MIGTITRFASLYRTQGALVEVSWPSLFATFNRPYVRARKDAVPGVSATTYENNSRADGSNAISLSALVCEYDATLPIEEAIDRWGDYYGKVYTTYSHRPEAPRFRLWFPYPRPVTPAEHLRICKWAVDIGGPLDIKASRDAKRFWFEPSCPPGGAFEAHDITGAVLEVDDILARYPAPAPPPTPVSATSTGIRSAISVVDRARAYLARVPGAISGQGGHAVTFRAARVLVQGFALDPATALELLREWNSTCDPPWSERELVHKIRSADTTPFSKPRGFLLAGRAA